MRRQTPLVHCRGEGVPGGSCCGTGVDAGRDECTRVVVEDIHDPHRLAVGECPAGRIDLPRLVRSGPLGPLPKRPWAASAAAGSPCPAAPTAGGATRPT